MVLEKKNYSYVRRLGPRSGNRDQPRDNFYRPEESAQEVDTWDNNIASSGADQNKDSGKIMRLSVIYQNKYKSLLCNMFSFI